MSRPILADKVGGLDYHKGIPVGDLGCKDVLCPARENRQPYRSRQNRQ